jgi:hypothetical protein
MANVASTMLTKVRLQILSLQLQDQFNLPLQLKYQSLSRTTKTLLGHSQCLLPTIFPKEAKSELTSLLKSHLSAVLPFLEVLAEFTLAVKLTRAQISSPSPFPPQETSKMVFKQDQSLF